MQNADLNRRNFEPLFLNGAESGYYHLRHDDAGNDYWFVSVRIKAEHSGVHVGSAQGRGKTKQAALRLAFKNAREANQRYLESLDRAASQLIDTAEPILAATD